MLNAAELDADAAAFDEEFQKGLRDQTLNADQLASHGLAEISWNGRSIYAKARQWLLGFRHPEPTYSVSGELLDLNIEWASATDPAPELQARLDKLGLGVRFIQYLGARHTVLIDVPQDVRYGQLAAALRSLPDFLYVEPNGYGFAEAAIPDDPEFDFQYSLNQSLDADIDAPEAWDIAKGHSGAVVAVLDSGVRYTHLDLAPNIFNNPYDPVGDLNGDGNHDDDGNGYVDDIRGYDFAGPASDHDNDPDDPRGHGTHVAGIIAAAGDNSRNISGVAWSAKIMPLRMIDAGGGHDVADAVEALHYVTVMRSRGVNVRVANNSYFTPGGPFQSMRNEIQLVANVGVLFIAAAGNDNQRDLDVPGNELYPASYNLPNVITVAATDRYDAFAYYSNHGETTVDLAAPGTSIRSTWITGSTVERSGTSQAAPHVSGVAALAFSVKPNETFEVVRDAIFNGVDVLPELQNHPTLGRLVRTGGRLNARRTLDLLSPASMIINGDRDGIPNKDTVLVRRDPTNSNYVQALVNGVEAGRKLYSSLTRIDVNGLDEEDDITVEGAIGLPTILHGGVRDDIVRGGGGNDTLYGGIYVDRLYGNGGNDTLYGGDHNDILEGGSGNDVLHGDGGSDTLTGGTGADSLYGDAGDDVLYARDSIADQVLDGGSGSNDRAQIDSTLDTNRAGIEVLLA